VRHIRREEIRYIPELDGLRAFAIGAVLLVHCNFGFGLPLLEQWRSWGWLGVDLFFVISGYLITSILLASKDRPNYYRNFYARRGLRIWPLYYLLIVFVFVLSPHMGPWFDQHINFADYKWQFYVFYVQNLVYNSLGSFCMVITWSLCVEEQFYMVWPFVVRLFSRRGLMILLVVVVAAGTPFRMLLHHLGTSMGFFFTFTRLDPIAIGALVALRPRWFKYTWVAAPWAYWLLHKGEFEFIYLALALTFGSAVAYTITHENRFLASRPMVYIGRISYGMYIWHPIVFSLYWWTPLYRVPAHFGYTRGIYHTIMQCALSIPMASLSWKYIEKPILKLKRYFENGVSADVAAQRPAPQTVLEPALGD
jgi:peptidoglycan/LPS O-acetylase OafA/YrhL